VKRSVYSDRLPKKEIPRSCYSLGLLYDAGLGVRRDHAEALKWIRRVAQLGWPDAQDHLGGIYELGNGVPIDNAESVKWYRLAADQGHPGSQLSLGFAYEAGEGVARNYVQACKWFNISASYASDILFPDLDAKSLASDQARKSRDAIASKMKCPRIAEAQRLARDGIATHQFQVPAITVGVCKVQYRRHSHFNSASANTSAFTASDVDFDAKR
jgi:hypothetical protein